MWLAINRELTRRPQPKSEREGETGDAKCCVASVRAGYVIGGGDWSDNRIIPDIVRAAQKREALVLRRPQAIRPWQHVLDPIRGYLQLAEALFSQNRQAAAAWNFGPGPEGEIQVLRIVERAKEYFPKLTWRIEAPPFEEANLLAIDSTKAETGLKWSPLLTTEKPSTGHFPGTRTTSVGKRPKN